MTKLYLTVDLEKDPWTNQIPSQETTRMLNILKQKNQLITFFVSGEVYEEAPDLVDLVATSGHEIGLHSYHHHVLNNKEDLVNELNKAADFIKKYHPKGFRAPCIRLPTGSLGVLKNYGFLYDSSVFFPMVAKEEILEIPASSFSLLPVTSKFCSPKDFGLALLNLEIPYGSGLFTALLPAVQRYFINRSKQPCVIYLHPWQLSKHKIFGPFKKWGLLPYTPSCEKSFTALCQNYTLSPISTLV